MDMVREILQSMSAQPNAITMRHMAHSTGIATSTIVGVAMGMLNQGYIIEVLSALGNESTGPARCACACCRRKIDKETTTSLDRRIFRITPKGERYLKNWSEKSDSL